MDENERKTLLEQYIRMPEEDLVEMLMLPENDYREGIFPLVVEAAKSRGLYSKKDEIYEAILKSTEATRREDQLRADQFEAEKTLPGWAMFLFVIGPAIGCFYWIWAPKYMVKRRKTALKCWLSGSALWTTFKILLILVVR